MVRRCHPSDGTIVSVPVRPIPAILAARWARLQCPAAVLIALLQRTPVVRLVAQAGEAFGPSPTGAWIRAAAVSVGALGAIDTMAGATTVVTASPESGASGTVGQAFAGAAFSLTPTSHVAESWEIVSGLPPGLSLDGQTTANANASLTFNTSTTALNRPGGAILLSGTPTASGTYTLDLVAYEYPDGGSNSENNGTNTAYFTYSITISTSSSGTPPSFNLQPTGQSIASGSTVVFTAAASGNPAPSYQWDLNGSPIFGAASARLVITGATIANQGTYTCVATNAAGTAMSGPALLSVYSTDDPGHLINLSVRNEAGSGNNTLTIGFYTGGLPEGVSGTQTLLVRGMGPTLAEFSVPSPLPDPVLTLYSAGGTAIETDAGWNNPASNGQQVADADQATGAFAPMSASSLDSAFVVTESAGGFTATVTSASGDTGTALAEIYDDTPGTFDVNTVPRLINLSARTDLASGATLTAGFVLGGATAKTLLIRAVGPGLTPFGVSNVMADPQLTLHATVNNQDTVLASNQGWGNDPQLAAVMSSVGAFSLTPNSNDAVLLITLPAGGAFTAEATSASGGSGSVLVEVYEVP